MKAGRELDELMVEVMGWTLAFGPYDPELRVWSPSTNMTDAWEVVERLDALGYWFQGRTRFDNEGEHDDGCWAGFTPHLTTGWNGQPDHYTNAPSMPHAICLAALKAVGIDIPD